MTEIKHTPTPWKTFLGGQQVGEIDGQGICAMWRVNYPEESEGDIKDNEEGKANAEFIVHACNNHYPLIAALEAAKKVIAELITPDAIKQTTVIHTWAHLTETDVMIRAALSKAQQ